MADNIINDINSLYQGGKVPNTSQIAGTIKKYYSKHPDSPLPKDMSDRDIVFQFMNDPQIKPYSRNWKPPSDYLATAKKAGSPTEAVANGKSGIQTVKELATTPLLGSQGEKIQKKLHEFATGPTSSVVSPKPEYKTKEQLEKEKAGPIERARSFLLGTPSGSFGAPSEAELKEQAPKAAKQRVESQKFLGGIMEGLSGTGIQMSSPANLAALALMGGEAKLGWKGLKLAKKVAQVYFTGQGIEGLYDDIPEAKKAFESGDSEAAGRAIAAALGDSLIVFAGSKGSAETLKKAGITVAEKGAKIARGLAEEGREPIKKTEVGQNRTGQAIQTIEAYNRQQPTATPLPPGPPPAPEVKPQVPPEQATEETRRANQEKVSPSLTPEEALVQNRELLNKIKADEQRLRISVGVPNETLQKQIDDVMKSRKALEKHIKGLEDIVNSKAETPKGAKKPAEKVGNQEPLNKDNAYERWKKGDITYAEYVREVHAAPESEAPPKTREPEAPKTEKTPEQKKFDEVVKKSAQPPEARAPKKRKATTAKPKAEKPGEAPPPATPSPAPAPETPPEPAAPSAAAAPTEAPPQVDAQAEIERLRAENEQLKKGQAPPTEEAQPDIQNTLDVLEKSKGGLTDEALKHIQKFLGEETGTSNMRALFGGDEANPKFQRLYELVALGKLQNLTAAQITELRTLLKEGMEPPAPAPPATPPPSPATEGRFKVEGNKVTDTETGHTNTFKSTKTAKEFAENKNKFYATLKPKAETPAPTGPPAEPTPKAMTSTQLEPFAKQLPETPKVTGEEPRAATTDARLAELYDKQKRMGQLSPTDEAEMKRLEQKVIKGKGTEPPPARVKAPKPTASEPQTETEKEIARIKEENAKLKKMGPPLEDQTGDQEITPEEEKDIEGILPEDQARYRELYQKQKASKAPAGTAPITEEEATRLAKERGPEFEQAQATAAPRMLGTALTEAEAKEMREIEERAKTSKAGPPPTSLGYNTADEAIMQATKQGGDKATITIHDPITGKQIDSFEFNPKNFSRTVNEQLARRIEKAGPGAQVKVGNQTITATENAGQERRESLSRSMQAIRNIQQIAKAREVEASRKPVTGEKLKDAISKLKESLKSPTPTEEAAPEPKKAPRRERRKGLQTTLEATPIPEGPPKPPPYQAPMTEIDRQAEKFKQQEIRARQDADNLDLAVRGLQNILKGETAEKPLDPKYKKYIQKALDDLSKKQAKAKFQEAVKKSAFEERKAELLDKELQNKPAKLRPTKSKWSDTPVNEPQWRKDMEEDFFNLQKFWQSEEGTQRNPSEWKNIPSMFWVGANQILDVDRTHADTAAKHLGNKAPIDYKGRVDAMLKKGWIRVNQNNVELAPDQLESKHLYEAMQKAVTFAKTRGVPVYVEVEGLPQALQNKSKGFNRIFLTVTPDDIVDFLKSPIRYIRQHGDIAMNQPPANREEVA